MTCAHSPRKIAGRQGRSTRWEFAGRSRRGSTKSSLGRWSEEEPWGSVLCCWRWRSRSARRGSPSTTSGTRPRWRRGLATGICHPSPHISVSDNQTTPGGNRRHLPLQNPVQYRNRVVEAVKVGNPRPVHPSAPSSLRNHTAAPVRAPISDEPSSTATPPKSRNDRANQLEDVQRRKAS